MIRRIRPSSHVQTVVLNVRLTKLLSGYFVHKLTDGSISRFTRTAAFSGPLVFKIKSVEFGFDNRNKYSGIIGTVKKEVMIEKNASKIF